MSQFLFPFAIYLIRAFLAIVLLIAGAAKLSDTRSFTLTLLGLGMPLQAKRLIRGLTLFVPVIELGVGLLLASGLWPNTVAIISLVLFTVFSVVVFVALKRTPHVKCRCFGSLSDSQFSGWGAARNILFLLSAAFLVWGGGTFSPSLDSSPGERILLVCGYLVFAVVAGQAAETIADIKERAIS